MKPVFQQFVNPGYGDCLRAAHASLFDLPLEAVPHFIVFPEWHWTYVFMCFIRSLGWEYYGQPRLRDSIHPEYLVNGHTVASVPSRTFADKTHSVVIDAAGKVAHDPNPNQAWLGEDLIGLDDVTIDLYKPRDDENWLSWLKCKEEWEAKQEGI